jgi:hypothetical protein
MAARRATRPLPWRRQAAPLWRVPDATMSRDQGPRGDHLSETGDSPTAASRVTPEDNAQRSSSAEAGADSSGNQTFPKPKPSMRVHQSLSEACCAVWSYPAAHNGLSRLPFIIHYSIQPQG